MTTLGAFSVSMEERYQLESKMLRGRDEKRMFSGGSISHGKAMNEKRTILGWAFYDWANSAYATTAAVAVLPVYFAGVVVPAEGYEVLGANFSATSLWGVAVGFSAILVFLASPWLGAVADNVGAIKKFLAFFCISGSVCTMFFAFTGQGDVFTFLFLFVAAQAAFASGNVFYDAFLPHIASKERQDAVSAKGFAFGYAGGGLQFAFSLCLIAFHNDLGLSKDMAARLALVMTGLWWAGFAAVTFVMVPEPRRSGRGGGALAAARAGFHDAVKTFRKICGQKKLRRFLLAYLLYNDGIQTALFMATIYGKEELGLSDQTLMLTLLVIQFVALFGALAFGRLGTRWGARKALTLALCIWTGIALYAACITSATQFFVLGTLVGAVMGGSQALSRSLFSSMIPKEEAAGHFGFFSIMTKLSAVAGPFMFAAARQATGSSRPAVALLAAFFLSGLLVLNLPGGKRQE